MTCTTTTAIASRDATTTTLRDPHDMTADYYTRTLAIVAGLLPKVDIQPQPKTVKVIQRVASRLFYSLPKPKCPMLENIIGSEVASPTCKRAFVMSELVRRALARAGMVAGRMGHTVRLAARRNPCFQHPAHPLRLKTWLVDSESRSGVPTMTQAITALVRSRAPVILQSQADTSNPEVIRLHAAAENALASAPHLLRATDCDPAKLQQATGRAIRASVLLKRACAAQVEGAAA